MPIAPLYDHVILRRLEAAQTRASGLIVPTGNGADQWVGEVVACGQGKLLQDGTLVPLTVCEGDRVIISTKSDYRPPISVDGEELFAFRENELVGVLYDFGDEIPGEDEETEED
jgi:chaperonin GroES